MTAGDPVLARSLLFVPADRPDRIGKALGCGADLVILDLEDSVLPERKTEARRTVARVLADSAGSAERLAVRVNPVGTEHGDDDCAALAALPHPPPVMLPKAGGAGDVDTLVRRLPGAGVLALVETARGVLAAREIAAHPATSRLVFGALDLTLDTGIRETADTMTVARAQLVLASAAEGLPGPVDGVTVRLDDPAACSADSALAAERGFTGKLCIHPAQVQIVNSAFAPGEDEVRWARRVLASGTAGASRVDGAMVDAPVRARAEQILRRAAGTGRHEEVG